MGSVRAEERRHLSPLSKIRNVWTKLLTKLLVDRPFVGRHLNRIGSDPKRGSKRVQSARGYTQR